MKLTELINALDQLEDACTTCNRCGMCQAVCPVFRETGREGDVARGKIALVDGIRKEILTRPGHVLDRLNRCLLCGACQRNCSRKADLVTVFLKARLIINGYLGLSHSKRLVFRVLLRQPVLFDRLSRLVGRLQRFLADVPQALAVWNRIVRIPRLALLNGRTLIPPARQSFRATVRDRSGSVPDVGEKKPAVLFFTGCLIDKIMPEVGRACVEVLRDAGVDALFAENEVCCGIPALSAGDGPGFCRLVEQNIDGIGNRSFDALVTACATCTLTVRDIWPSLYQGGKKDKVQAMAGRVMDIHAYLFTRTALPSILGALESIRKPDTVKTLTYHEPCHLKQGGVSTMIRDTLKRLPGYRYVETRAPGTCCGMGGSFNLSHYDLSSRIGERKAEDIVSSGADIVCTACPACMMQLKDMLHKTGATVEVRHVMEIVSDALSARR